MREKALTALEVARGRFAEQTANAEACAAKLAATRAEEEQLTAALDSQSQSKVCRLRLARDPHYPCYGTSMSFGVIDTCCQG